MKIKKNYLLVVALVSYVIITFPTLGKPFFGHHDWIGVWESNIARNLTRYSILDTKLGSVINAGPTDPQHFAFGTHYPLLLPVILASTFNVAGESEVSARALGVIFTLFSATMVFKLGTKYFRPGVGILSAAIFLAFPITIYFGRMPEHEILVIGPVLLALYLYLNFFKNRTLYNFIKLIAVLIFAHLIHWPAYYITPLLAAHFLIFSKDHKLKIALVFPLLSVLIFGLHLIHIGFLTGELFGGGLVDALLFRLNVIQKPQNFTLPVFVNQEIHLLFIYFTKTALVFSLVSVLWKLKRREVNTQAQISIILGIFGITHIAVFQNMAYIHDYMIIYLAPFVALSASAGLIETATFLKLKPFLIFLSAILIVGVVFFERREYLSTLYKSNSFYTGYLIGSVINKNTNFSEKSLVLSQEISRYFDVFVAYYADREVLYALKSGSEVAEDIEKSEYKMYVAAPLRDTPINSVIELRKLFNETVIDGYYFYTPK